MLYEPLPSIHQHFRLQPQASELMLLHVLPQWGQPRAHLLVHRFMHGLWVTSMTLNRWGDLESPCGWGGAFCSVTVGWCPGAGGQAVESEQAQGPRNRASREQVARPQGTKHWRKLAGVLGQLPPDVLG